MLSDLSKIGVSLHFQSFFISTSCMHLFKWKSAGRSEYSQTEKGKE